MLPFVLNVLREHPSTTPFQSACGDFVRWIGAKFLGALLALRFLYGRPPLRTPIFRPLSFRVEESNPHSRCHLGSCPDGFIP